MIVLALDISKERTGWCVDSSTTCPPHFGSWSPALGCSNGTAGVQFQDWLFTTMQVNRAQRLVYEAPILGGHGVAMQRETAFPLIGLAFAAEIVAASRKTNVEGIAVSTVRAHFLGNGRLPGEEAKRQTVRLCRQLGWQVKNDDEGDACALWAYAKAKNDPKFRYEAVTPLFAGKP